MQVNLLHPCLSRPHVCVVGRVCTTALSIANAHSELRAYLPPGPTAPFPFFFLERLHQCILTSSLTFRAVPNQLAHWCTAYDTPHLPSLMIGIILLWCESAYFFLFISFKFYFLQRRRGDRHALLQSSNVHRFSTHLPPREFTARCIYGALHGLNIATSNGKDKNGNKKDSLRPPSTFAFASLSRLALRPIYPPPIGIHLHSLACSISNPIDSIRFRSSSRARLIQPTRCHRCSAPAATLPPAGSMPRHRGRWPRCTCRRLL